MRFGKGILHEIKFKQSKVRSLCYAITEQRYNQNAIKEIGQTSSAEETEKVITTTTH